MPVDEGNGHAIEIDSFDYVLNRETNVDDMTVTVNLVVHDTANAVAFMKRMVNETTTSFGVYVYTNRKNSSTDTKHVRPILDLTSSHAQIMEVHQTIDESEDHAPFHAVLKLHSGDIKIGLVGDTGEVFRPAGSGLEFGKNNV